MTPSYQQMFEAHKACVIIPTYNNEGTVESVIQSVLLYTTHIIVVNDGSTDATNSILLRYPTLSKVSHPVNRGKGKALRTGFDYAMQQGYDYAITIDSDGQHYASDLPLFLQQLEKEPASIVIGARNLQQENMPEKNTFANKFSNFWFYVETGKKAPDTQSGYRLYPLYLMRNMRFFGKKYEFEVEVLVRSSWNGIKITWIPVHVYYPPPGERISHFRPFPDFSRISVLNTILVLIAFLYIKPRDLILRLSKMENVREILRQNLFNKDESVFRKSASIGLGVFMGIFPAWGFQMLIAVALATLFRLNKALTLIASNISIPPMIPVILFLSFITGRIWIHNAAAEVLFSKNINLHTIMLNSEQYIYGSITLSIFAGLAAFGLTYTTLHVFSRLRSRMQQVKN